MSHFSLLLVTDEKPTAESIAEIMAPFDEQSEDPRYRKFEDETEELTAAYKSQPDGYKDVIDFIKQHRTGVHPSTGKPGYFSNDSAKWDWYSLGGRFLGGLLLKEGKTGEAGVSGVGGNQPTYEGGVDSARVGDIDFEGMKASQATDINDRFDKAYAVAQAHREGITVSEFDTICQKAGEAYPFLNADFNSGLDKNPDLNYWDWIRLADTPDKKAILEFEAIGLGDYTSPLQFNSGSRQECLATGHGFMSFAILKDGMWLDAHMDEFGYKDKFKAMVEALTPDQYITVIDCHI